MSHTEPEVSYTTIIRWCAAHGLNGYRAHPGLVEAVQSSPEMHSDVVETCIETIAEEVCATPAQVRWTISKWVKAIGPKAIDMMALPTWDDAAMPSAGHDTPITTADHGQAMSLAVQAARIALGIGSRAKLIIEQRAVMMGRCVEEGGERVARMLVRQAACVDGANEPLIASRDQLLAFVFGGEEKVPGWVRR